MSEAYSCTYCKSTNSKALYPTSDIFGDSYEIAHCSNCSAYFLTPPPDAAILARAYSEDYYGEGETKFKSDYVEKTLDFFRRQRAKRVQSYISKGNVLDVGCGNGRFLSFVQELGEFSCYGIEMPGGSAERAKQIPGLTLKVGSLEANDFEGVAFDAVTLFHVFEHLSEPKKTLEILSEKIKSGGILVLSFPNIDSWQSRFFKGKWLHLDPPRHLFFFRPKDLEKHLNGLGFELVKSRHFTIEYNPFGAIQSWYNLFFSKREVLYESLKGNKEYTKEYSKRSIFLQDTCYKLLMPFFMVVDGVASLFKKGATVELIYRKK